MPNLKKILFVCTANICRSFMAEYLMKHLLKEEGSARSIEVSSAGILAWPASEPSANAMRVLREAEIEPDGHRTTRLSKGLIEGADLVLVMEENHKDWILNDCPGVKEKVYLLKEFAGLGREEILDPIGCSYEAYETCLAEIKTALLGVIERLKKERIEWL